MEKIVLNHSKNIDQIEYNEIPVVNISKIHFKSELAGLAERLSNIHLLVSLLCIDQENKEVNKEQDVISLNTDFIRMGDHVLFEVNKQIKSHQDCIDDHVSWIFQIEVIGLKLKENEEMEVHLLDKRHIKRRVDDWAQRVSDFASSIQGWISDISGLEIVPSRKERMYEELMRAFDVEMREIQSYVIKKEGKTILVVKPSGLWIMGANGKIDLLSAKGNVIVTDTSEQFQTPNWAIHPIKNRNKPLEFTSENFLSILEA